MTMQLVTGRVVGGAVAVALLGLAVPGQAAATAAGPTTETRLSQTTADEGSTAARRVERNITLRGSEPR